MQMHWLCWRAMHWPSGLNWHGPRLLVSCCIWRWGPVCEAVLLGELGCGVLAGDTGEVIEGLERVVRDFLDAIDVEADCLADGLFGCDCGAHVTGFDGEFFEALQFSHVCLQCHTC